MKNSFASWDELKGENPEVYETLNLLMGKQWYRTNNSAGYHYRFVVTSEFNPYRFTDNFHLASKEQMARLAEEAMYREAAKEIPFREYVSSLTFSTTIIWVPDISPNQLSSYEFPEYLTGWLNGIYIGIDRKGETNS
ncbi:MAG: hypothetical protein ACK45I_03070 [Bacteroidota bacterium]|jgi:hypothetical protein